MWAGCGGVERSAAMRGIVSGLIWMSRPLSIALIVIGLMSVSISVLMLLTGRPLGGAIQLATGVVWVLMGISGRRNGEGPTPPQP